MNKARLIFYGIFGAYQLIAFIFTLIVERSASFLLDLVGYVGWFKYITFLGLTLIIIDAVWAWRVSVTTKKTEDEMRLENNTLKAKVYDMQEKGKPKPPVPTAK